MPSKVTGPMIDGLIANEMLAIVDSDRCPWVWKLKALERARDWLLNSAMGLGQIQVAVREYESAKFMVIGYDYNASDEAVVFEVGRRPDSRYKELAKAYRESLARVVLKQIELMKPMAAVEAA